MTDRVSALTVVLEQDMREDDAVALVGAIKQLRGVMDVSMHVSDLTLHTATTRARLRIAAALWKALEEVP